jgi:hypothetical protein
MGLELDPQMKCNYVFGREGLEARSFQSLSNLGTIYPERMRDSIIPSAREGMIAFFPLSLI